MKCENKCNKVLSPFLGENTDKLDMNMVKCARARQFLGMRDFNRYHVVSFWMGTGNRDRHIRNFFVQVVLST